MSDEKPEKINSPMPWNIQTREVDGERSHFIIDAQRFAVVKLVAFEGDAHVLDRIVAAVNSHAALTAEVERLRGDNFSMLALVADIRRALGDDGRRMQSELIEWCKELRTALASKDAQLDAMRGALEAFTKRIPSLHHGMMSVMEVVETHAKHDDAYLHTWAAAVLPHIIAAQIEGGRSEGRKKLQRNTTTKGTP